MARRRTLSPSQRRRRDQERAGMAIIAAVALAASGMLYGAYKVDQARGITVAESLDQWGL